MQLQSSFISRLDLEISGVVVQGQGISSGKTEKYPGGSISMQKPFFKANIPEIDRYHNGTINLEISRQFAIIPEIRFDNVDWRKRDP